MNFKKDSLAYVGQKLHICLSANEKYALFVPLEIEKATVFHQDTRLPVQEYTEDFGFGEFPIESFLFPPEWFLNPSKRDK